MELNNKSDTQIGSRDCQWSSLSFISTCPSPAIKSTVAIWYSIVVGLSTTTLLHKHCCRYNLKSDYKSNNNRTDREQAQNKWWNVGEHTYCRYRSFAITWSDFFSCGLTTDENEKQKSKMKKKLIGRLNSFAAVYELHIWHMGTHARSHTRIDGLAEKSFCSSCDKSFS